MMKLTLPTQPVPKILLIINIIVALLYFSWWFQAGHVGHPWLYGLLVFGEIYHVAMALTFWHTVWPGKSPLTPRQRQGKWPSVDVFIPVAGEPEEIVRATTLAAKNMDYPNHKVYILNDGKVTGKNNWREIQVLAQELGVKYITRTKAGGAKAGNINNALKKTRGKLIAVFDADMVASKDFLKKTVPYFENKEVGFVQTPQYYQNADENEVSQGAWDQQKLFFGPILAGKDKSNAVFICGTNVLIRRQALEEVGGMAEDNIAEDFLTSLYIHKKGWKSRYLPEVLAKGMAPTDINAYYTQQFRWSRGSVEILFGHNPVFSKTLSWHQKIEYLASAMFYLNGLIILIDAAMPLIFLFTGLQPVAASTTSFAIYFLPFMFLNLYTLNRATGDDVSFKTFAFSYSLWFLQLTALISLLLKRKVRFAVTPKEKKSGSYWQLVWPHLTYTLLAIVGSLVALYREQMTPAVATNMAWAIFSIILFIPFVLIAGNLNGVKNISSPDLTWAKGQL